MYCYLPIYLPICLPTYLAALQRSVFETARRGNFKLDKHTFTYYFIRLSRSSFGAFFAGP